MFQSPQWGSNPKEQQKFKSCRIGSSFSPRNGEVILKALATLTSAATAAFQSPQWGSNPKGVYHQPEMVLVVFQSPQWGSNPKVPYIPRNEVGGLVRFSPRNGEVILKWLYGREK